MIPIPDPPTGEHALDRATLARVPLTTGVYAAWLIEPAALQAAGINGRSPLLMYVAKASSKGGLQQRLRRHAKIPWWEVADLLASTGVGHPGWWAYAEKNHVGRIPPMPLWRGRRSRQR